MDCSLPAFSVQGILQARILEWVAMPSSRGIFPTQGSNPGLPHCRQILYCLRHPGSSLITILSYNTFLLILRTCKIYSLSNFQMCNTVLLTIVAMLYVTSPWIICYITVNLYLLTPFMEFYPTPTLCLWQPLIYSLYLWASFCLKDHMVFMFLWILYLSILSPISSMLLQMARFHSFYDWIIYCCVYITLYLSTYPSLDT